MAARYRPRVSYYCRFKLGDRVAIISGRYAGRRALWIAPCSKRPWDWPEEHASGYHVAVDEERWLTHSVG